MMRRVQFDLKLSLGHIAQIVALVVGGTAGYYGLKADAADVRSDSEIARLELQSQIEANTARIESQGELLAERLFWIGQTLEQMRGDLKAVREQR